MFKKEGLSQRIKTLEQQQEGCKEQFDYKGQHSTEEIKAEMLGQDVACDQTRHCYYDGDEREVSQCGLLLDKHNTVLRRKPYCSGTRQSKTESDSRTLLSAEFFIICNA